MRNTLPAIEVIHEKKLESTDIRLENINLDVPGKQLLVDADFIMTRGKKYGLIGRNGIGKTTLLYAICRKEFKGMDKVAQILLVEQEVTGDERSVLQTILDTDSQRRNLLEEEESLKNSTKKEDEDRLVEVYK